jgi:hypothetical protein
MELVDIARENFDRRQIEPGRTAQAQERNMKAPLVDRPEELHRRVIP